MTTIYFGFDCSTKAIHAVLLGEDAQILHQQKWASTKATYMERFLEITANFWTENSRIKLILNKSNQALAAIEAAIYIQNPHTTLAIASVVGCTTFICDRIGLNPILVDNRKWKKELLGKGNASKADILKFAQEKWGDVFEEQDYADAACIALWRRKENFKDEECTT